MNKGFVWVPVRYDSNFLYEVRVRGKGDKDNVGNRLWHWRYGFDLVKSKADTLEKLANKSWKECYWRI